ncbi:MAG TPA: glycoside hydrolase family 5 protein [Candidatus Binatia bacterium]|nr:glycoside hydrolase family 5 protein [Candidatus Binatia bacterium]
MKLAPLQAVAAAALAAAVALCAAGAAPLERPPAAAAPPGGALAALPSQGGTQLPGTSGPTPGGAGSPSPSPSGAGSHSPTPAAAPLTAAASPSPSPTAARSTAAATPSAPASHSAAPSPSATPSGTAPVIPTGVPSALHVSGNQLVDANGVPVTLHGADMSGTETVCAQNWTNDPFGGQPEDDAQTFAAMRSWGINAVRIPLNEDCWLGINGVQIGGAAYQQPVEKLVRDLEAAGFYVIVDLHWTAPGTQRAVAQNPAPDEDHSPAFWQGVAGAFKDDPAVIFDLFNEPYFYWMTSGENQWTCLWQGCTVTQLVVNNQASNTSGHPCDPSNNCYTADANWQTAGFDQLISIIRGAGAANVIMAGGADWARDLSGWLATRPSDPNLVASWHSYPSANPSLQSECAAEWCWNQVIAPLAAKVPVVVGETGDSATGPETYLTGSTGFLPWAKSHGLSVLAWTWNAWQDPSDVLVTSMTAGTPTPGEGVAFQAYLRGFG